MLFVGRNKRAQQRPIRVPLIYRVPEEVDTLSLTLPLLIDSLEALDQLLKLVLVCDDFALLILSELETEPAFELLTLLENVEQRGERRQHA